MPNVISGRMSTCITVLGILCVGWLASSADGFQPVFGVSSRRVPTFRFSDNTGEVGRGPNWVERSFPVTGNVDPKSVDDYNLGISGVSFQTGPLSLRMYDAIMSNKNLAELPDEIVRAYQLYSMDFTAKEATRAALKQNGLELTLLEDEEDEGMWGDVDSIRLLDPLTNEPVGPLYDSVEEAVDYWSPGQSFDFVVRQVPAKMRELTLDELMAALDPDGTLREQAKAANMSLPDEDITSLRDLAADCMRRSQNAPREAAGEGEAFAGLDKRGYRVIHRSDLLSESLNDEERKHKTTMHVMNALVSHGALVVDLTDGGTDFRLAETMEAMWSIVEQFFDKVNANPDFEKSIIGMKTVSEAGSGHAKVGYANTDNGAMQFLETRYTRSGNLLPSAIEEVLGSEAVDQLRTAYDTVSAVGKDVVRIATTASTIEAGVFEEEDDEDELALEAATRLAHELVDDSKPVLSEKANEIESETSVSMSPHRLCRYSNKNGEEANTREVFGAHTDSSFITIVPVAAVGGLEVYDEAAECWYRPELAARNHWKQEHPSDVSLSDTLPPLEIEDYGETRSLPWHARYVVLIPGELLQLVTRNEIPAAVHRVVATRDGPARFSAPILLRCRSGFKMDVDRYLGGSNGDSLLEECDGLTVEEIYDSLQPSSFQ